MLNINLLPWRKYARHKKRRNTKILFCLIFTVIAILLLVSAFNFNAHQRKRVHIQKNFITNKIYAHPKIIAQVFVPQQQSFFISDEKFFSNNISNTVSFKTFKLVGYMSQQDKTIAFLQTVNNETIAVKSGDKIGVEHASIVAIDEHKVILEFNNKILKITRNGGYAIMA